MGESAEADKVALADNEAENVGEAATECDTVALAVAEASAEVDAVSAPLAEGDMLDERVRVPVELVLPDACALVLAVALNDGVSVGCPDSEAATEAVTLIEPVAEGVVVGVAVTAALPDEVAELDELPDGVAVSAADTDAEYVTEPVALRVSDVVPVALPVHERDSVALRDTDGEPESELVKVSAALPLAESLRELETEPEAVREVLSVAVGDTVGVCEPDCDGGEAVTVVEPLSERDTLAVALLLAVTDGVVEADGGSDALVLRDGVVVELTVGDAVTERETEELAVAEAATLGLAEEEAGTLADADMLAETDDEPVSAAVADVLVVGEREALRD